MKLEIIMPNALDASNVEVLTSESGESAIVGDRGAVTKVTLEPIFYSKSELANGPAVRLTHGGKVLFLGLLRISGNTGNVSIREMKPVIPEVIDPSVVAEKGEGNG